MKLSARNVLKGKVKKVVSGMVNSEIVIELPGGTEITSIITKTSAENMNLKEGTEAYAIIKASNVMIAIDWLLYFHIFYWIREYSGPLIILPLRNKKGN